MTWNTEQAANDLERYLLRGEPPATGSIETAITALRRKRICEGCVFENELSYGICSTCSRYYFDKWKGSEE